MKILLSATAAALLALAANGTAHAATYIFSYTGGWQYFQAPTSGEYRVIAYGAQGGYDGTYPAVIGGRGAEIGGDFNFAAGETLAIAVGGSGGVGGYSYGLNDSGGGGGGTFISLDQTALGLLIAAGGGGGANGIAPGLPGQIGPNGLAGGYGGGVGGTSGAGGAGSRCGGGGGAGVFSDGSVAGGGVCLGAGGPGATLPDLAGGTGGGFQNNGGFGGGGGGATDSYGNGGGGGGGYSGGGGGGWSDFGPGGGGGGGGGSYLDASATHAIRLSGLNAGNGEVIISTALPEPAGWAMMLFGFSAMGAALRSRRQAAAAQA